MRTRKAATYLQAITWAAAKDCGDEQYGDVTRQVKFSDVRRNVTTQMIADLYGKPLGEVTRAIMMERENIYPAAYRPEYDDGLKLGRP